jgi:hypothetical protein
MSGGYIDPQPNFAHQVVIFTLIGQISNDDMDFWNTRIESLKQRFGTRLAGVTLVGKETPERFRPKNKSARRAR